DGWYCRFINQFSSYPARAHPQDRCVRKHSANGAREHNSRPPPVKRAKLAQRTTPGRGAGQNLARCKRGTSVLLRHCSGIAPALLRCCERVVPLYIPCTSLVHPLYNRCTCLGYPLRLFRNFGAATVLWRPILNSSFDNRWENCYGSSHGTANLATRLCEVLPDRFRRRSVGSGRRDSLNCRNSCRLHGSARYPSPGDDAD